MSNPFNALALAKAVKDATQSADVASGLSVLIYGPPKTGKTALAATAAEASTIDRVFMFDNERSWEVLIWMLETGKISEEAASKIIVISITDTPTNPYAIETMLKVLMSEKAPVYINYADGKILPQKPVKFDPEVTLEFQISKLTKRDIIIADSLSQLGASAMRAITIGRGQQVKPTWDDYGAQGQWLADCLSVMQVAKYCHFIAVTHEQLIEGEDGIDRFYPMCGTRNFSTNVAKFFNTVIATKVKLKDHVAGSSTTYSKQHLTGSRRGITLESMKEPTLKYLFDPASAPKDEAPTAQSKPSLGGSGRLLKK